MYIVVVDYTNTPSASIHWHTLSELSISLLHGTFVLELLICKMVFLLYTACLLWCSKRLGYTDNLHLSKLFFEMIYPRYNASFKIIDISKLYRFELCKNDFVTIKLAMNESCSSSQQNRLIVAGLV